MGERPHHLAGGTLWGSYGPEIAVSGCVHDTFVGLMLGARQRPNLRDGTCFLDCSQRFVDEPVDWTPCFVSGSSHRIRGGSGMLGGVPLLRLEVSTAQCSAHSRALLADAVHQ